MRTTTTTRIMVTIVATHQRELKTPALVVMLQQPFRDRQPKNRLTVFAAIFVINGRTVRRIVDTGAVTTLVHYKVVKHTIESGKRVLTPCANDLVNASGVPI